MMKNMHKGIKIAILTFLACLCIVKLWDISSTYIEENNVRNEMLEYLPPQDVEGSPSAAQDCLCDPVTEEYEPELSNTAEDDAAEDDLTPMPVVNQFVRQLQDELNSDIIGWLCIPGTNIDYPVVSAGDNDFYLHRDIHKKEAQAGTLFTDYRCAADFAGFNTVVYGHNMRSGSMFGDLRKYADPEFMAENRYGILYTTEKTYTLELFAFMVIASDDAQIYANPESKEEFHKYIRENARVYSEPEDFGKVIVLSTCAYEFDGARIVVTASVR